MTHRLNRTVGGWTAGCATIVGLGLSLQACTDATVPGDPRPPDDVPAVNEALALWIGVTGLVLARGATFDMPATVWNDSTKRLLGFPGSLGNPWPDDLPIAFAGAAYCWGWNIGGQAGSGSWGSESVTEPSLVVGDVKFAALSTGGGHTCGLTASGKAYCWGLNIGGQLGSNTDMEACGGGWPCSPVPVPVEGDLTFRSVVAGHGFLTCGIGADEETYCWGDVRTDQGDSVAPVPIVEAPAFEQLAVAFEHACGLTESGEAYGAHHDAAARNRGASLRRSFRHP